MSPAFSFLLARYWFGNIPRVKKDFSAVILVITFLSVLPMVIEYFRRAGAAKAGEQESPRGR